MTSVVERSTVQPEADRSASAADDSEQAEPLTDEEYGTLLWVKIGELRYDASNARSFMQGGAYHTFISTASNNTLQGIFVTHKVVISGHRNRAMIYALPSTNVVVSKKNRERVTIVRITRAEMATRLGLVPSPPAA